jgi:hypothetical protein
VLPVGTGRRLQSDRVASQPLGFESSLSARSLDNRNLDKRSAETIIEIAVDVQLSFSPGWLPGLSYFCAMDCEIKIGIFGGVCAIVGGLLNGAYEHLRDWFTRPRMTIAFIGGPSNIVTANYKIQATTEASEKYIRARVRNTGRSIARSCRVYITALLEVHPSGTIATTLDDAKQLAWAGHHFVAIDVPMEPDFYVDVVRFKKGESGWLLSVEKIFASQVQLAVLIGFVSWQLLITRIRDFAT